MYYLFSIFIFQEFGPVNKLRSGTRQLFPTLCSGTAPTNEHVYVSNHAWRLVDWSSRCARRLRRSSSTFMFPTTLGDLSTSPYAVLGDCADHRARLRSQPCSGTGRPVSMPCSETMLTTEHDYIPNRAWRLINHSPRCARDLLRLLSDHSLGIAFLSYI